MTSVTADRRIWSLTINGIYTVKSAYHRYMSRLTDSGSYGNDFDWRMLWDIAVPPKIKIFTWKACSNVLPMRLRLHDKGVNCPSLCLFCNANLENCWPIFLSCEHIIPCWHKNMLWTHMEALLMVDESSTELFFRFVNFYLR